MSDLTQAAGHKVAAKLLTEAQRGRELLDELEQARRGPASSDAAFWAWWSGRLAEQVLSFMKVVEQAGVDADV